MHLNGMNQLMVRAFVIENSSRFIAFCKDEELSEDDFLRLLEEMDFNEIVTPGLLAKFRL